MQLGGKGGAVDYLPPWKTLIFNNPEKSIQSLCSVQPNIYNKNAIANANFFKAIPVCDIDDSVFHEHSE